MSDLSSLPEPLGARARVRPLRWPRAYALGGSRVRRAAFILALALLALFAFAWVWRVGHRGLFVLDESIVFDGAWRVYQGQVPYRDFVMPFGPVTFWLQALAFRAFGVDFSSLVLTAALLSAFATLLVVRLVWRLTGSRGWSLLSGLLTAVWYQAPFGIPWMEQTAFLFDLFALLLVIEGRLAASRVRLHWVLAGVASVLALLSKQNAGGLFVLVCLGCIGLPTRGQASRRLRDLVLYAAGGATAALAFACWLALRSSPATFLHYWLSLSAGVGWERVAYWKLPGTLVFQPLLGSSIVLFIASSLVGVAALLRAYAAPASADSLRVALAGWIGLALPQFHSFFQLTTNNDPPNNNAFVGVCVAATGWLLARCLSGSLAVRFQSAAGAFELALPRRAFRLALLALVSVAVYSAGEGISIAWTRNVQEFMGSSFSESVGVPRLRGLLWGEPTRITPQFCGSLGETCKISGESADRERPFELLRKADFEAIAAELERRPGNFFVFPDTTILYGALSRPSPQPLLYFHPGQSYALAEQAELDRWIVASLREHAVESVVLERASFMGTHKLLHAFPELERFVREEFRLVSEHGNYQLFERVPR